MPRLTDPKAIRARLEEDRPWTAFALADLEPPTDRATQPVLSEPHAIVCYARHADRPRAGSRTNGLSCCANDVGDAPGNQPASGLRLRSPEPLPTRSKNGR